MNITFGIRKGLTGLGLILVVAFTSCQKKDIPFGENFVESFTNILIIDTLSPEIYTYKLDSFSTSGTGVMSLGGYTDPQFGVISGYSTFQIGLPAFTISRDDIYDSITLILKPNKQYYGDTLVPQQISVHQLTQELAFAPERNSFYNNQAPFNFDPTPLGQKQFIPRPSRSDSLEIRLSDAKGTELFAKMKDKSTEVTTQADFLRYFRGITLRTSPNNAAILGYTVSDSSLKMRVYYRERGISFTNKYVDFPVTNTNLQYNHIDIDRSGTPLANLPAGFPLIPSSALGKASYMQFATGLITKVTFPSLQNLLNIDKTGKILKAELYIKPAPGTFKAPYTLPAQITLSSTDKTNLIGTSVGSASLFEDYLTGENTGYTFDITSYLQGQIVDRATNQQGLFVYSPSSSLFNRLVIGDIRSGTKSRIQVKIYYLVIQ